MHGSFPQAKQLNKEFRLLLHDSWLNITYDQYKGSKQIYSSEPFLQYVEQKKMDNPSYEADEKGSVHLQSIKRIKEPDNLKVRQSNATYTNRSQIYKIVILCSKMLLL